MPAGSSRALPSPAGAAAGLASRANSFKNHENTRRVAGFVVRSLEGAPMEEGGAETRSGDSCQMERRGQPEQSGRRKGQGRGRRAPFCEQWRERQVLRYLLLLGGRTTTPT